MSRELNHNEAMIHFSRSTHGPGRCGAAGDNRYSLHWSRVTCLRCIDKRGNLKEKMLWAGGITASIIVLLTIIITIAAPDSEEEISVSGSSSELSEIIQEDGVFLFSLSNATAGTEVAQQMVAEGTSFDEAFVQEAVYRIKRGDPNDWLIRRADVMTVCEALARMNKEGLEASMEPVFRSFDDGLHPTMLGIIIGADPGWSATAHYCDTAGL